MKIRACLVALSFSSLVGCAQGEWAGVWSSPSTEPNAGNSIFMTLDDTDGSISGQGSREVEAGSPAEFTVTGSASSAVDFRFDDGHEETFSMFQMTHDFLALVDATGNARGFDREHPPEGPPVEAQ